MPPELISVIAGCCFLLGMLLGQYLTHCRWAANAKGSPRVLWGRRFYYVVEDGDVEKAREVVRLIEDGIVREWGR